jgi:hypothetical protein
MLSSIFVRLLPRFPVTPTLSSNLKSKLPQYGSKHLAYGTNLIGVEMLISSDEASKMYFM